MLREVKDLLGGRPIMGLAPSAAAARVLGREAGIGATTLQWFLTRFRDPPVPGRPDEARAAYRGAVLAVDECSMIDTERMRELLRIANDLGVARIALVGDTAQLRAVDAGQPFRLLQKAGMRTATMDEVLRQEDGELREAVLRARHGEPGDSIRGLRPDRVREVPRDDLGGEAARCWLALMPDERADTAVMAPTHEIRRQANEAIREGLAEEGTLHGRILEIDRLVNRHLTRALAADIASYEPGDTVVFHRDVYGCRANDVCTVTEKRGGRVILAHMDGGERSFRPAGNAKTYLGLFDTERIELRAGDRIRWTRNRKAPRRGLPDLVNGGEAEIVEIGRKRVRFRDADREFSLARSDPQLRHLDHAYCTTVHAAQGKTATGAIAILDAGGATDQAMFHVEISRVRREFLLLTDDRNALIELLEGRADSGDGALEALGIDPGSVSLGSSPGQARTGPGSVSPGTGPPEQAPRNEPRAGRDRLGPAGTGPGTLSWEEAGLFASLERDWRALERRAGETGTVPFFLPGYRAVMARAAGLAAVGDLTGDLQRLADRMLAEHRRHLAHDREVRGLVERIREHWRRWPELGWAAEARGVDEIAGHAVWREDAAALAEDGRRRLAANGEARRHLEAMPGTGLADALAGLERTCRLDDARRFERLWGEHCQRAEGAGVPALLGEGYAEVAALAERLETADGLDARARDAVADWRVVHDEQAALAEAVDTLPGRVAAWQDRRAGLPLDGRGEAGAAREAWRRDGDELAALANGMLQPDDIRAPYLDAAPGARDAVQRAAETVRETLRDDAWERFASAAEAIDRRWEETGIEPLYLPRYLEMIAGAKGASRAGGPVGGRAGGGGVLAAIRRGGGAAVRRDPGVARPRGGVAGPDAPAQGGPRCADRMVQGRRDAARRFARHARPQRPVCGPHGRDARRSEGGGGGDARPRRGGGRGGVSGDGIAHALGSGVREAHRRHPLRRAGPWRADGAGGLARRQGRVARTREREGRDRRRPGRADALRTGNGWARSSTRRAGSRAHAAISTRPPAKGQTSAVAIAWLGTAGRRRRARSPGKPGRSARRFPPLPARRSSRLPGLRTGRGSTNGRRRSRSGSSGTGRRAKPPRRRGGPR